MFLGGNTMAKKTFTIHLAKGDTADFDSLLSESARELLRRPTTRTVEDQNFGEGAKLYVFVGDSATPSWFTDLGRHFTLQGDIRNSSSCAVLAFRTTSRMFVATFAHGWMYLNEDQIEGDFGLRAAINALDETKLKRLERANLGDALRGVSLSPFQRDFNSFGLEDALDLISRISGNTRDDSSADSVSGSRSYKVSGEYSISDLPELAAEALSFFNSVRYRASSFRVIDLVTPITDHRLGVLLDELATQTIRDGGEEFELGLPISQDDDSVAYKFQGPRLQGRFPDLLLRHYVASLGDKLAGLTTQILRDHKIVAVYEDGRPNQKSSVRTALVGSVTHNGGQYAINGGEWYRVDELFKTEIQAKYNSLVTNWAIQPTPLRKIYDADGNGHFQPEDSYNREFAEAFGFVLLDKELIAIPGVQRSGFEACDILDIEGKRFIHIKKSSRRSTVLSHFFKQGSNAAQQFSRFPAVWDQLLAKVEEVAGRDASVKLSAAKQNTAIKWTVMFVIADSPRTNGEFNIPFFSKISLRDELIGLNAMGYDVEVRFIGLEPEVIQ
jgi:uncharacterized protein (TIGR04141 family)